MIAMANRPKTQTASTHSSVIFAEEWGKGGSTDCALFWHNKRIDLWTCHIVWACVVLFSLTACNCCNFGHSGNWQHSPWPPVLAFKIGLENERWENGAVLVENAKTGYWWARLARHVGLVLIHISESPAEAECCQLLLLLLLGSNTVCRLIVCRRTWSSRPRPSHIRGSPPPHAASTWLWAATVIAIICGVVRI